MAEQVKLQLAAIAPLTNLYFSIIFRAEQRGLWNNGLKLKNTDAIVRFAYTFAAVVLITSLLVSRF